jgi:hypothetical protein
MKKISALSVVLALLAATPALARAHHQRSNATYGYVASPYVPAAPTYRDDVPFAPF